MFFVSLSKKPTLTDRLFLLRELLTNLIVIQLKQLVMSIFKPQLSHRARHGGYYKKPTKAGIKALNSLYQGIQSLPAPKLTRRIQEGTQIKMNF